jgi:glycosidase
MKKIFICIICIFIVKQSISQDDFKVYPTHWWVGMKNPKLQLMIHRDRVGMETVSMQSYPGVKLVKTTKAKNPNYIFMDLVIEKTAKPGTINFKITNPQSAVENFTYELKQRSKEDGKNRIKGITSEDFIYLIMPDRFSNGDPSNDRVPGMRDQSLNRDAVGDRHGGDLKGIQNHLDYLQGMGVTALWLNPVIENDMSHRTEHGYAFTNHYKIEPRIGGEVAYHELINDLHNRGMKIIQDAVYNHTGIEHFLFRDMPDSTWFHRWPTYTNTTYKDQTLMDPYASVSDKKRMTDGWFVPSMPDINQDNPEFATFLIQHAIWSTEEFGLDGWRIDTYAYNDLKFMNRCNKALLDEYPQLHMFGETWVHGIPNQAYFAQNNFNIPFKSNLPGVTDFQTHLYGIIPALTQGFGWTEGVNKLYSTLANDFVYKDPMKNVNFLDNHDMSRFYSQVGENLQKYKMGIAWLLTCRGIPQLYYGTEILMKGFANPDGLVRMDFPGGWPGDAQNKFESSGRSSQENEAFDLVKTFANYRKNSSALKTGKMMQFVPENGVYVYFRFDNKQTIMCIMNQDDSEKEIDGARFAERTNGFSKGRNVVDGSTMAITSRFKIPGRTLLVLELIK